MIPALPCPELVRNATFPDRFNSDRFKVLHRDAQRLIAHWFQRAHELLNCDPADSFEPFIYAWIAVNGWASCCTDLDQDRQIIDALCISPELILRFEQSLAESDAIRS